MEEHMEAWQSDYNWEAAFEVACRGSISPAIPGSEVDCSTFTPKDVESVLAMSEGENDGQSWVGAFGLKDGRFVMVSAWCDYSGWG